MNRILYVLHSGNTGGTFLTNIDLMKNVEQDYEVFLLSAENDFFRLYKYSNSKLILIKEYVRYLKLNVVINDSYFENRKWSAKEFNNSWLSFIYFDIFVKYGINIVHIRHLINHSFDLPQVANKLGIPVILSIHDFYFLCPFYVLLDDNHQYCAGKCNKNKNNCFYPMDSLSDINSKEFIQTWRYNVSKMFRYVDMFITTSNIVKNLFLSIYSDENIINPHDFKIIEHGRDFPKLQTDYFEIPSAEKPIKILFVANHLNIMKGSELIKSIKNQDKNDLLEFHFLGNCHDNLEQYGVNHGTFERDEFYKKVKEIKPSFIGIFSIWPETFCHTLTEAWSCGIPVIGTNIGVIEDRILKNNGGWIIDRNNPKRAFEEIISFSNKTDEYLQVVRNIKQIKLKDTKTMSEEYLKIYKYCLNFIR